MSICINKLKKLTKDEIIEIKAKLLIEVMAQFDDNESSDETVRYLVEQDLEDNGFSVISCELINNQEVSNETI